MNQLLHLRTGENGYSLGRGQPLAKRCLGLSSENGESLFQVITVGHLALVLFGHRLLLSPRLVLTPDPSASKTCSIYVGTFILISGSGVG